MADQDPPPQGSLVPPPPGGGDGNKNLVPINIEDEMRRSYLDYAMSVIVGRALPDIRDGLKPVHRRILYGMHEMGLAPNRPTAQVRQDHRRGDGKVPSSRRCPDLRCVGAHGAALFHALSAGATGRETSARSTATRRRPCGTPKRGFRASPPRCCEDIDKETVDFRPNYDESESEPEVLPTRVPNLLVNGSAGIAVGMATNIPPHNLTEIINATIHLIQHPRRAAVQNHGDCARGPISPPAATFSAARGSSTLTRKGRGPAQDPRPRQAIEAIGKDREAIIVTEIPYQVNKSRLIEQMRRPGEREEASKASPTSATKATATACASCSS